MSLLSWLFPPKPKKQPLFPPKIRQVHSYLLKGSVFKVRFSDNTEDTIFTVEKIGNGFTIVNLEQHDEDTLSWFFGCLISAYPTGFIVTINEEIYVIKNSEVGKMVVTGLCYTTGKQIVLK